MFNETGNPTASENAISFSTPYLSHDSILTIVHFSLGNTVHIPRSIGLYNGVCVNIYWCTGVHEETGHQQHSYQRCSVGIRESYQYYNDVIMSAMALFTQPFIQAQIKENIKARVTGLCAGNSPVTGEFPAQRASNAEKFSIWWRHHEYNNYVLPI